MKLVQAALALGFFGWLGYVIYSGNHHLLPVLTEPRGLITPGVDLFGTLPMAVAMITAGCVLALNFLRSDDPI